MALTRCNFVDKVMSLLFNMISRLVVTFLPRSKHLLISFRIDWFDLLAVPGTDPISWQTEALEVKAVTDFMSLGSKITEDSDYSHEIKRCLLLGRKVMTNIDSILKSRGITLPTNVHIVKAMVFLVVMYACESWTIRKLSVEELMLSNSGAGEES